MLPRPATLLLAAGAVGLGAFGVVQRSAPVAATAAAIELKQVRLGSGLRLRYVDQGPPSGPVVVMLHGYTDTWFSFSRVLPLMPSTLRIIVPDQRGHGASDRPEAGYSMPEFASDVVQLLEALQIQRATVVGHSMGSFVARQVALAAPDRVERLVLIGAGATARNDAVGELRKSVDALTDPVDVAFAREFQASMVQRPVPPEFLDRVVADTARVPARVWKSVLAGILEHTIDHSAIRQPTLVIGGDRDTVFTQSDQEHLARLIPNATVRIVAGIGHSLQWEQPDLFARALADFMTTGAGTR